MRTVIDTNVVVSAALLPRSLPRRAFDAAAMRGRLLLSDETLGELHDVLRRPKFDQYLSEELRLEFLAALVREAEVVEVVDEVTVCRDPKDNKFLDLALSGRATHVVTGDSDLLVLHPFGGIAILSPRSFVAVADTLDPKAEPPNPALPG